MLARSARASPGGETIPPPILSTAPPVVTLSTGPLIIGIPVGTCTVNVQSDNGVGLLDATYLTPYIKTGRYCTCQ